MMQMNKTGLENLFLFAMITPLLVLKKMMMLVEILVRPTSSIVRVMTGQS